MHRITISRTKTRLIDDDMTLEQIVKAVANMVEGNWPEELAIEIT